jgi:proline dehydrogenase
MTKGPLKAKKMKFGSLLSIIVAPFARRFIAGITLTDALKTVSRLSRAGFHTTLDHLGEDVENKEEASEAANEYLIMLRALGERGLEKNVSLKLSQMGLGIDKNFCLQNLKSIVSAAETVGGFVRVDMEGSPTTDDTLDIIRSTKTSHNTPAGIVLQAMLKRTPDDLINMLENKITIRLCKGAYKENSEIAFTKMNDIRREFIALAKRLLTSGMYHGIATHDPKIISEIRRFAQEHGISKNSFEFQMLLGIRTRLQKKLVANGYRVRIYVPFGRSWLAYSLRRLREKKENLWFFASGFFN